MNNKAGSIFEEIIAASIARAKAICNPDQLPQFELQLKNLPKKLKEFNAEPYLFIFERLLLKKDAVDYVCNCYQTMVEENYITTAMLDQVATQLKPLITDHSYSIIQVLLKIKEPSISIFHLFFDIHSSVPLPEDHLKKVRLVAYSWLAKAFSFSKTSISPFIYTFFEKGLSDEMPSMASQSNLQLKDYVSKILNQMILLIEDDIEMRNTKGKYGFCFMCRSPANFYCKDTKVPVCGAVCKKEHLSLLSQNAAFGWQFTQKFKGQLEELLLNNIVVKKCPNQSISFLSAIYLHSSYVPQNILPHRKILSLPVINERIWMLYTAYYEKKHELFQHIFLCALDNKNDYTQQIATEYFMKIAATQRIFECYYNYDVIGNKKFIAIILNKMEDVKKAQFLHLFIHNIFNHHRPSISIYSNHYKNLIRAFNHEKSFPLELFSSTFGSNYQKSTIHFLMKHSLEINRQKLSDFLSSNDNILSHFLELIIESLKEAEIDEILRQIFTYINIKVSDKIYHLLELFYKLYEYDEAIFNQNNFFQYCYFIIMIVTELHNPGIVEKCTILTVNQRIKVFHPVLVEKYPHLITNMYERVSTFPFSQQSRGILDHYESVVNHDIQRHLLPEIILLDNWEYIYENLMLEKTADVNIYHCCIILAKYPPICKAFLQLLINRLDKQSSNESVFDLILKIIEMQPNAVGNLWYMIFSHLKVVNSRPVLKEQHKQEHLTINRSTAFAQLILSTKFLSDENLIQFIKQLNTTILGSNEIELLIKVLTLNHHRLEILYNSIIDLCNKIENDYILVKFLCFLISFNNELIKDQLYCFVLKKIQSCSITEGLLFQLIICFEQHARFTTKIWEIISEKVLHFQNQKIVTEVESLMRHSNSCICYEAYLIQKTLNCQEQTSMNADMLSNLQKIEPYLHEISPSILMLFLIPKNICTIARCYRHFCYFQEANSLLQKELMKGKDQSLLTDIHIEQFLSDLQSILEHQAISHSVRFIQIQEISKLIMTLVKLKHKKIATCFKLFTDILKIDSILIQPIHHSKEILIKMKVLTILAEEMQLYTAQLHQKSTEHTNTHYISKSSEEYELLIEVQSSLKILYQQCLYFTKVMIQSAPLKQQLVKSLQSVAKISNKFHPSLLKAQISFCKSLTFIAIITNQEQQGKVVNTLAVILDQLQNLSEKENIFRNEILNAGELRKNELEEVNKSYNDYKLLFIESLYVLIEEQQECKALDRKVRQILIKIVMEGFYDNHRKISISLNQLPIGVKLRAILKKISIF